MYSVKDLINDPIALRLLLSLVILLITLFAKRVLSQVVIRFLSKIKIGKFSLDTGLFDHLQKPINYILLITGIYIAMATSPFVYYHTHTEQVLNLEFLDIRLSIIYIGLINKVYSALFAAIVTWIIYDLIHLYEQFFTKLNQKHALIDNTVFIRYLSRILNFITIVVGTAIVLILLVPDLSSILTGVGIGGAAVAFVAKDSLTSIFSGMVLLLDKPFIIGDWIAVDNIEGIVEDISFRSTRIRTFSQGLVVVPNSTIGNATIINWSRMEKRYVSFELSVSYDTSNEQIVTCTHQLKHLIAQHPEIETDTVLVRFSSLGEYSLKIQITYYTLKIDLASYLEIKEAINLKILEICEANHISIAFPTQTILMPSSNHTQN